MQDIHALHQNAKSNHLIQVYSKYLRKTYGFVSSIEPAKDVSKEEDGVDRLTDNMLKALSMLNALSEKLPDNVRSNLSWPLAPTSTCLGAS